MAKKFTPPTAAELKEAFRHFSKDRPRASAVMAAAWVDDALRAYLEAYLGRDRGMASALLRADAPLGTFGTRIKLAYLLGLIGPEFRAELDLIREIRNDFAHVRTRVSFKTDSVISRCESLRTAQFFDDYSVATPLKAQERFVLTTYFVTEVLITLAEQAKPVEPVPEFYFAYVRRVAKTLSHQQLLATVEDASEAPG